jgi:hypothetical protein
LHAFIVAIFNQISNQNVRLIIAISGKAVYKYRYQISECTFLLLPFSLPTRQSVYTVLLCMSYFLFWSKLFLGFPTVSHKLGRSYHKKRRGTLWWVLAYYYFTFAQQDNKAIIYGNHYINKYISRFIVGIFNQIANQNKRLIIAISGKAVYKYRYQISECTFLLLPFSLPTRQSSKIITTFAQQDNKAIIYGNHYINKYISRTLLLIYLITWYLCFNW